eukprot:754437-Hanusia_phi.AAC.1
MPVPPLKARLSFQYPPIQKRYHPLTCIPSHLTSLRFGETSSVPMPPTPPPLPTPSHPFRGR